MNKLVKWALVAVLLYILITKNNKSTFINFSTQEPSVLNQYFDKIVCISIPKRRRHMENMMRKYNIDAEIFPAYMKDAMDRQKLINEGFITPDCSLNDGRICCHYSHMQVLKNFIDNPLARNILVFEDDMGDDYRSSSDLNDKVRPYLESLPQGWNYLNLGTCWDKCNMIKSLPGNKLWKTTYRPLCRNAIAFSKQGANTVYSMCRPMKDKPGDNMIAEVIKNGYLPNSYNTDKQLFKQNREQWGTNLNNTAMYLPQCTN